MQNANGYLEDIVGQPAAYHNRVVGHSTTFLEPLSRTTGYGILIVNKAKR
jgi:hypothetical protein